MASSISSSSTIPVERQMHDAVDGDNLELLKSLLVAEKAKKKKLGIDWATKEWILEKGAPLHLAAHRGNNQMVRLLVESGFDVNSYCLFSEGKVTVLHAAVMGNRPNTVNMLLREFRTDASLEATGTGQGLKAADFATGLDHTDCANILKEHAAAVAAAVKCYKWNAMLSTLNPRLSLPDKGKKSAGATKRPAAADDNGCDKTPGMKELMGKKKKKKK